MEAARKEGASISQPPAKSGTPPKLSEPKVEAHWIEGRAQGNRWVDGHWEYVILEPAHFTEGE
jgi:hypothetical protein